MNQEKSEKLYIHIIGCRVLTRELSALIAKSRNVIDVSWLPQGMHDTPVILHRQIEEEIQRLYTGLEKKYIRFRPDYIVLGYGLCSRATEGITAGDIPIVIPRTDDCIALFLGSEQKYRSCFDAHPGTFWLNSRWVEEKPSLYPGYEEKLYQEYLDTYEDEDTAQYLMEEYHNSLRNYTEIGYIHSNTFEDSEQQEVAADFARRKNLYRREYEGSTALLQKIVDGQFDEQDFCILRSGETSKMSLGPEKMTAVRES